MNEFDNKIIAAIMTSSNKSGCDVGKTLQNLRKVVGLTQKKLASSINVNRTTISKIENRKDIQLSTLKKYVEALGAVLRVEAEFSFHNIDNVIDIEVNDQQLALPIFDEVVPKVKRDVIISIRPKYTEKILEGMKTVELRRRFPVKNVEGAMAYIYSTSPVKAIVGYALIFKVVKLSVGEIWDRYKKIAFINKYDFDVYFDGVDAGYVIELVNVKPLPRIITLEELRHKFDFKPPQSFYYAQPKLLKALKDEHSNVSY